MPFNQGTAHNGNGKLLGNTGPFSFRYFEVLLGYRWRPLTDYRKRGKGDISRHDVSANDVTLMISAYLPKLFSCLLAECGRY